MWWATTRRTSAFTRSSSTLRATASRRMDRDSRTACLPSVVLTMRSISSFLIMSTTCGRPSRTLSTLRQAIPSAASERAVPSVATISKPRAMRSRASGAACGLSRSRTEMKQTPLRGSTTLALLNAFGSIVTGVIAAALDRAIPVPEGTKKAAPRAGTGPAAAV